jgi:tRNA dimethylallyltransferase
VTPSVLVLAGPTASGKTEVAIAVAERFGAVVISADAMQVYRGLDIGTGKATAEQRASVRHYGIDLVAPDEPFDASRFVHLCGEVLEAHPRVILAGGTSLYIQALIRGLVATPPVDADLRARLEALPDPHAALAEVDPALAVQLHPHDRVRVVRGLEVWHQTGSRLSELRSAHAAREDRVRAVGLWLDRQDLDERIASRVDGMMERGYVAEVRGLVDRGYHRQLKPMLSLGYRHLCDHVIDGLPLDEATRRTVRDTRRFARKQRTWMRALGFPREEHDPLGLALEAARSLWGDPE